MDPLSADRIALRYLVEAYASGCDNRDAELLSTLFSDGAALTVHWIGRDPTTMHMPGDVPRLPKGLQRFDRTMHFIGNHRAVVAGDTATGETYCFAHHISGTNDHIMAIRYEDTYRREADGWRFTSRDLRLQWTQDTTVSV